MHALLGTLAAVLLVAGLASAGDEKKAPSPQANRMTECNAEAHDKKLTGDTRKQFMAGCLKKPAGSHEEGARADDAARRHKSTEGDHAAGQGGKMKACNQEAAAKNLHGDDRKHFMSQCLKSDVKSEKRS